MDKIDKSILTKIYKAAKHADKVEKCKKNAPGPRYVDTQCIDCDVCQEIAPTLFKRDPDGGFAYVVHQPATAIEKKQYEEAKRSCPVQAIH